MEQRGAPVERLAELGDLAELAAQAGPFLTIYLPLRPATEELATATGLRWRALREDAEAQGVPEALLADVDEAVEGAYREAAGLAVVAVEGGKAHVEHLATPPDELVAWQATPVLVPLVEERQRQQPYVVALVDRQGADIAAHADGTGHDWAVTVDGDTYPLSKVGPGGWSQRRFQQRAEETWHRNMATVAADLASLVGRHDPRVVAVGGDERAVNLLVEALPMGAQRLVRRIDVTRATDGSIERLEEEIDRALTGWTAERLGATEAAYQRELGQHDRATTGAHDTLAALGVARVATLIVPTARHDDVDTAVAAALTSGADVQALPPEIHTGQELAAILRW